MRIHFVGHASVVLDYDDVVVWTDPWLRGDAFNDAWTPWPPPQLDDALLDRVTHVWVSHEHPDHLSIGTLKSLPPEWRARVELVYQTPWADDVPNFLRTLGWKHMRELPHGEFVGLGGGVDACVYQVGHEDSALVVRGHGRTVLDLNDCKPGTRGLRRLHRLTGPIDVLLDQFSIAGWPGNAGDDARIRQRSERALSTFRRHVDALQPQWTVPFASFVRFCHEDNAYMNAGTVPVERAADAIGRHRAAVLYPGDSWAVADEPPPTDAALTRYADARAALPAQPLRHHDPVPFDDVLAAARARTGQLREAYHRPLLRALRPVVFQLADLDRALVVDVARGTVEETPPVPAGAEGGRCVVEVSSQAAKAAFTDRWGMPTLLISGRLRLRGDERAFQRLKQLGSAYSTGVHTKGAVHRLLRTDRGRHLLRHRAPLAVEVAIGRRA